MIDQAKLGRIFRDCLFQPEEIPESGAAPEGAVCVRGIAASFGLHPGRLVSHRAEVAEMLEQLPDEFMASKGGGWSFLNVCQTRDGEQWTGFHGAMEQLFVLGIGLELAKYLMPREAWAFMPGGMPYIVVGDRKVAETLAVPTTP